MNYKVAAPLEKSKIKTGSDTRNFNVKKVEDKVVLRFDEENQIFYAKIENPSSHTKYLAQQGKLGIALCKLNTGKSQRNKMCGIWEDEQENIKLVDPVKHKFHPRWSRCGLNVKEVSIANINNEIPIPIGYSSSHDSVTIGELKPNQKRTIGNKWQTNWFTSIKAVLLSSSKILSSVSEKYAYCRAYKTMSNRIKIRYDSGKDAIVERKKISVVNHYHEYYDVSANVMQSGRNFTITITSMGTKVQEAFNQGKVWIGVEINDAGYYSHCAGHSRRAAFGDKQFILDEEGSDSRYYTKALKCRRYKFKLTKKEFCPKNSRQYINSTTYTYYIPEQENNWKGTGAIQGLLGLMYKHGDYEDIVRRCTLVIGMDEGANDTGRRLWRQQTDVSLSFSAEED